MPMSHGSTAAPITKGVLKLARQINAASTPDYVAVEPGEGCIPEQSDDNATEVVKQRGGSVQHGWRMREQAAAFVEAHFHAVWLRPDGVMIDVTPRKDRQSETLFLPDPTIVWTGEPIEPRRIMLNLQPCYCGSGLPFRICHGAADD